MKLASIIIVVLFICVVSCFATETKTGDQRTIRASARYATTASARLDERKFKYNPAVAPTGNGLADPNETKQEISKFMNTKNIVKTVVKLIFGSDEESAATSRQILNLLVTVLDMVKTTFGSKSRSSSARSMRGALDDAAVASASMLKGFLRSAMTKDENCMQRYLCEASRDAAKDGNEVGYLIAQFGGYAASYALESQKKIAFSENYNATRAGRSGDDCLALFTTCNETD